eukprot:m.455922 g.455922  ORF g.455922 m.455922 type:complete len:539 (-) comp20964_c0_seq1:1336-2952(-)
MRAKKRRPSPDKGREASPGKKKHSEPLLGDRKRALAMAVLAAAVLWNVYPQQSKLQGSGRKSARSQEVVALLMKADHMFSRGDNVAAAAMFERYFEAATTSRQPIPPAAHFNAASSFSALGKYVLADQHYRHALATKPAKRRAADAFAGLAITASRRNEHLESIALWRRAVGRMPKDEELMFALGRELERADKMHEAEARFRIATELNPNSPRFHHFHGMAVARRNATQARRHLLQALNVTADADAFHLLAVEVQKEHPDAALKYFGLASARAATPMHARAIVYSWGKLLAELGREADARTLYADATERNIFADARQRPLVLEPSLLPAEPWPGKAVLNGLKDAVQLLESNSAAIKAEWLSVARDNGRKWSFTQVDGEGLATPAAAWRQGVLKRNGVWYPEAGARWPHTADVIRRVQGLGMDSSESEWMPKAAVEFSALAGGAKLNPHCGPGNHRIRLHLGLLVPMDVGIEVAGDGRSWTEGKVLVIDDSWEHAVWNRGDLERVVLIVDVWHPLLTRETRDKIRSLFDTSNIRDPTSH